MPCIADCNIDLDDEVDNDVSIGLLDHSGDVGGSDAGYLSQEEVGPGKHEDAASEDGEWVAIMRPWAIQAVSVFASCWF